MNDRPPEHPISSYGLSSPIASWEAAQMHIKTEQ